MHHLDGWFGFGSTSRPAFFFRRSAAPATELPTGEGLSLQRVAVVIRIQVSGMVDRGGPVPMGEVVLEDAFRFRPPRPWHSLHFCNVVQPAPRIQLPSSEVVYLFQDENQPKVSLQLGTTGALTRWVRALDRHILDTVERHKTEWFGEHCPASVEEHMTPLYREGGEEPDVGSYRVKVVLPQPAADGKRERPCTQLYALHPDGKRHRSAGLEELAVGCRAIPIVKPTFLWFSSSRTFGLTLEVTDLLLLPPGEAASSSL